MKIKYCLLTVIAAFLLIKCQVRKLIYVQQIFRHGARYPIRSMKNDHSQFVTVENEAGELTSEGKHMQYILGKIMYKKYWKELFGGTEFADKYHPSQIYVKSTNVNRTIESAQSQIQGLLQNLTSLQLPYSRFNYSFPPYLNSQKYEEQSQLNATQFNVFGSVPNFHSVPIHTEQSIFVPDSDKYRYRANPYYEGDFLIKFETQNCPNQNFWGKENMASPDAIAIKNSQSVRNFLTALSSAIGSKVKYEDAYHSQNTKLVAN